MGIFTYSRRNFREFRFEIRSARCTLFERTIVGGSREKKECRIERIGHSSNYGAFSSVNNTRHAGCAPTTKSIWDTCEFVEGVAIRI